MENKPTKTAKSPHLTNLATFYSMPADHILSGDCLATSEGVLAKRSTTNQPPQPHGHVHLSTLQAELLS